MHIIKHRFFKCFIIAFFLIVNATSAFAWDRSSPNVPPDSPLYRDLDKLVAWRLVHPPILGQKPYPRTEFARLTAEALKKFEETYEIDAESLQGFENKLNRRHQVEIVLAHLKQEFDEELIDMGAIEGEQGTYRIHPFEKAIFSVNYLNSPPTTIPYDNGDGTITAQVNPLEDYNLGRQIIDGSQFAIEPEARFAAGRFLSGYVRPRFEVDSPSPSSQDMSGAVYVQNAYGTFKAGNFIFEFGRDSMVWGAGERGNLLFSTNARPLDGIRITNPTPARLPWVFKYLGEWRYTLYGMNLGPGYSRKYAWLAGYKFSLMPVQYVEIGFGHAVQIGGEGTQSPSFLDVIGEFAGLRPGGTDPTSPNITNHMFEVELLVRIPQLRGFQIYGNMAIEDYWKSIKKTLTQGCSYLGGLYLPALNNSGSMDLRAEFTRVNPLQYRHSLFSDGYTINRRLLGSDSGPDSHNLHLLFRHTLSKKFWYGLSFDWDHRSSNIYTELRNADGTAGPIVKIEDRPTEQRYRGLVDLDYQLKPNLGLHLTGGYERALNLHYVQGDSRNNYLAAVSMTLNLDRHFAFAAR